MDTPGSDDWFARLAAALDAALAAPVSAGGPDVPAEGAGIASGIAPGVDEEERRLLLDLARLAAHTSERWTAPISTFLVGRALAELDVPTRRAALAAIVATLDTPA